MAHSDLLATLQQVRSSVPDDRHIWGAIADSFETVSIPRRGLLLGGAHSPLFLRDRAASADVPWTVTLRNARVLPCEPDALADFRVWLPVLETAAKTRESLLFVTTTIDPEFLRTLLVNLLQNTLSACVAHPLAGRAAGRALNAPPAQLNEWPLFAEARVRRSASVLFPADAEAAATPHLADLAEIRVGGRNFDDQMDRLRFLSERTRAFLSRRDPSTFG